MSCAREEDSGEMVVGGFLFAFYNYSQVCRTTWIEKLVHVATGADSIHVAILPVARCIIDSKGNIKDLHAEDITFTAFIGFGYKMQRASSVLNSKYKYIFLPVPNPMQYVNGINFLKSLSGTKYNYLELPLTLLPNSLKPSVREVEFVPDYTPSRVFCSQVGLMLLYRCGILSPHSELMDPSCCNPGDLVRILKNEVGGMHCKRNVITIVACQCVPDHEFNNSNNNNNDNNNNNANMKDEWRNGGLRHYYQNHNNINNNNDNSFIININNNSPQEAASTFSSGTFHQIFF